MHQKTVVGMQYVFGESIFEIMKQFWSWSSSSLDGNGETGTEFAGSEMMDTENNKILEIINFHKFWWWAAFGSILHCCDLWGLANILEAVARAKVVDWSFWVVQLHLFPESRGTNSVLSMWFIWSFSDRFLLTGDWFLPPTEPISLNSRQLCLLNPSESHKMI